MKTLAIAGLAGILALMPGAALAAVDSTTQSGSTPAHVDVTFASATALASGSHGAKKMRTKMGGHRMGGMKGRMGGMKGMRGHRMNRMGGQRMNRMGNQRMRHMRGNRMRNHANRGGYRFRNGANVRKGRMGQRRGYQRPHRGFQLPRTFIQPSFFIGNFGHYGLSAPSYGYGWSRYYDDAVLTDRRGIVYDSVRNVDWDRYNQGYNDGYRDGRATYDNSVFLQDDRVIATPTRAIGGGTTTYQGDWDGAYREDGSYSGDWQGTYRDGEGRIYEGNYSGTFVGNGDVNQVGASYADSGPHWGETGPVNGHHSDRNYDDRRDELAYLQQCKKSSGIGGAIVGGAVGALAGNRIAGRGNRLGGSLIGGGLGAIAGAAIDQGTDRCRKLLKKYGVRDHDLHSPKRGPHYRPPSGHGKSVTYPGYPVYPSGWQGGYYYPAYYYQHAQPSVTTVVIQSAPVTTTTTTTYVEEEVVYTKAKTKKRWKPAPKRQWKPKPVHGPLKGCQQAVC